MVLATGDAESRGKEDYRTLQDLLADFDRRGDRPAVIAFATDGVVTVGFRELKRRILALAGGLRAKGLSPGEPVALFAANSLGWVVCRLALVAADALCVPIDFDADAERLRALLEDSGATCIFCDRALLETVRAATDGMDRPPDVYLVDDQRATGGTQGRDVMEPPGLEALAGEPPDRWPVARPDAPVSMFYTSGTTGTPKAVPLTHANILTNVRILLELGLIDGRDRVCLPLPLHHSYPFIVGMLLPLFAGTAMVLPAGVSGPELVRALSESKATAMVGVPRLYEAMTAGLETRVKRLDPARRMLVGGLLFVSAVLRRRFGLRLGRALLRPLHRAFAPDLRLLACGGAKLSAETGWKLETLGYQVLTGYGLVETTSIATFNRPGEARAGSAGKPSPVVEMRLQPVADLDLPEIQFRGPIVFSGYRDNPRANAESFTGDGWFRTGDLGWQDDDGFLYIGGRSKEMIVLPDGKNVAPDEVEAVYGASTFVTELAVLDHGDRLVAVVDPDLEAMQAQGAGRLRDQLRIDFERMGSVLPRYKRISDFVVTREPLPRNQLGKYRRHRLPEIYERAERGESRKPGEVAAGDRDALSTPRARRLLDWLRARFPDAPLDPDASLQMDLDIDSLAWIDLSLDLERRLGVRLPEQAIAGMVTVRDLVAAVEAAPDVGSLRGTAEGQAAADRRLEPSPAATLVAGRILHGVVRLAATLLFGLRVEGRDNLKIGGPTIIAANHVSDLDPIVLAAALPDEVIRNCWWGADARRVFGSRLGRAAASVAHLFPIDDRAPAAGLALASAMLTRGRTLIWFPEEWRSPTGELQPFRPGVGALIAASGAAVIPVDISGTFEAMPRTARLPRPHPVRVRFGAPVPAERLIPPADDAGPHGRDQAIADRVHDLVAALGALGDRD